MKSSAMCLAGIFKGLQMASPQADGWTTSNEAQRSFLDRYQSGVLADLPSLEEYLESLATSDSAVLNRWFAERDFPDMNIIIPPGGVAIGTVFDLLVDWQEPGQKRKIYDRSSERWFAGVQMLPSESMQPWQLVGYDYPMFEIATSQDGWKVFLVEADSEYSDVDIPEKAMQLFQLQRTPFALNKLVFPSVDMQMDVDISFLVGLASSSGFSVDDAIKKVKLRLDDKGARAQSAVAMLRRGMESGVYKIDKPFLVIFWREGLNFPSFVALATPEHWGRAS